MTELDWETVEIDAIDEEDFWDLLTSATADVQEVALSVWLQLAKSDVGTGYTSIEAWLLIRAIRYQRRVGWGSLGERYKCCESRHIIYPHSKVEQTSGNETGCHLTHHDFQQRPQRHGPFDSECANI